ncbi:helix-turn-helix domain-containing protein [Burkholderia gladioli]|uniref:helix-turn-helix domain-containing protein n=1 Tax=Burkholderia gladioli TaxID=28095 RepID=UPI0015E2FAD3|nr:helix-turn-helix domain-containing protein [Burkholderia gladioli]MDN7724901.1 helix-turn-helix domain-containing protein [Burkholderia gladioli]
MADKYQSNLATYYDCNMETFGSRVRARREKLKWSQEDLRRAAGLSQSTIAQIESGRNKGTKHILQLAAALQVSPEWLQGGESDAPEAKVVSPASTLTVAAKSLIREIERADKNGLSAEAFDALKNVLKLLEKPEGSRGGVLAGDDPIP